jgi:exonuclease VII small subunit
MQAGDLAVARGHAVLFRHGHEGAEDEVFEGDAKFAGVALQRGFQRGLRLEDIRRRGLDLFVHHKCCWHFLVPFIDGSHVVLELSTAGRGNFNFSLESGVWSLESGVWSLESGVWSLESGVWRLESGVWSLETGVWRLETGDRSLETGVWSLESGVWSLESGERRTESGDRSLETGDWRPETVDWRKRRPKGKARCLRQA